MKSGSSWSATKARKVLAALERVGWRVKRRKGSHRTLSRQGWPDYVFAYHDKVEIGPSALKLLGLENRIEAGRSVIQFKRQTKRSSRPATLLRAPVDLR